MIYLLHGDDFAKSRYLVQNQEQKVGTKNRTDLNTKEHTISDIYNAACSTSLFGDPPFVVVDITESAKEPISDIESLYDKTPETSTLIVISAKSLPKTNPFLKATQNRTVKVIQNNSVQDSNVFRFVDMLFSKKRTATYAELSKLFAEDKDPFYIFSMIVYGLRSLTIYSLDDSSHVELKSFQATKLKSQSSLFSKDSLKKLYSELYTLEKQVKTGAVDQDIFITLAIEKVLNS